MDDPNEICRAHGERLAKLETKVDRLEVGVANFREFQGEARDFFMESRTERAKDKEFRELRDRELKDAIATREKKHDTELAEASLGVSKRSVLWTVVQTMVAIAAVAISIMAVVATVYLAKHSEIEPTEIFRGSVPALAVQSHQNAGGTVAAHF
jgi:hypothetical protein